MNDHCHGDTRLQRLLLHVLRHDKRSVGLSFARGVRSVGEWKHLGHSVELWTGQTLFVKHSSADAGNTDRSQAYCVLLHRYRMREQLSSSNQ